MTNRTYDRYTTKDGLTIEMRDFLLDNIGLGGEDWKRIGWDGVEIKRDAGSTEFCITFKQWIIKHEEVLR